MNEIIACPSCQRKVTVPATFFGKRVQCPQCQHTFTAVDPSEPAAPAPSVRLAASTPDSWDDPRPISRSRPYPYDRDSTDDYGLRRQMIPHRGAAVLTVGILSLVLFFPCSPVLGPIAWIMGHTDLKLMRAGQMQRDGEGPTQAGMILGMVTTILAAIILAMFCLGGLIESMNRRF